MGLSPGTQLGAYEIIALLGAGGMGEVYRARDTRLDRTVAIKVLPAPLAADPRMRERFEREARAISSLNHPHICALYDIGTVDSEPAVDFLVLAEHVGSEGSRYVSASVSETGTLVYGRGSALAALQLTWVDRAGAVLGTVGEPAMYINLALSPDEGRAAVSQATVNPDNRDICPAIAGP